MYANKEEKSAVVKWAYAWNAYICRNDPLQLQLPANLFIQQGCEV